MSSEEKMKRLLEVQEHPERYTDEEIRQLMADEECQRLYEQMVRATDAMFADQPSKGQEGCDVADITSRQSPRAMAVLTKVAAVFVGLLMLSGIAYATIHIVQHHAYGSPASPAQETSTTTRQGQQKARQEPDSTALQPVVFADAELHQILSEIATFYHCETVYRNERVKHIRLYFTWDKTAPIDDIVGTFNKFEQLNITLENRKLIVE